MSMLQYIFLHATIRANLSGFFKISGYANVIQHTKSAQSLTLYAIIVEPFFLQTGTFLRRMKYNCSKAGIETRWM